MSLSIYHHSTQVSQAREWIRVRASLQVNLMRIPSIRSFIPRLREMADVVEALSFAEDVSRERARRR